MSTLEWTDIDRRTVAAARVLAADAVEKAGSGHPGSAISMGAVAYLLYQKVMRHDPADPTWLGRDRFVLSMGHSSMTLYTQLYLAGYGLEMADLEQLRTWGSLTPGHPELGHTAGVECTTGPLGAGVSNAVGFAMAARKEAALYDPGARPGGSVFDHRVYCLAGDGDMEEGISAEASSLAGTLGLGNLIVIYDSNDITIEGNTQIAFSEDVAARYEAYGWHVQCVDFVGADGSYEEKMGELYDAIVAAQAETGRPSLIKVHTIIGWPLPNLAGSASIHGSKIGGAEIAALKTRLGLDPTQSFAMSDDLEAHARANAAERARAARTQWEADFGAWAAANPAGKELLDRVQARALPDGLDGALPTFPPGKMSTRAASGAVLTALADVLPELWGGSADLSPSNNTTMKGQPSFLPADRGNAEWPAADNGRTLHFGIREHAMGGIINAINISGLTRCYGGTFLVFSDYMRTPPRLAALSGIPSIFVWTHDSVGVGEDGPTHQPVEHIASLRLVPGLDVIRPSDANEVAEAWRLVLSQHDHPAALILTRQDVPTFDRAPGSGVAPVTQMAKGAYTLVEASAAPRVVLVGTGSEVAVAVAARETLEAEGIPTRVVAAPCLEWYLAQPESYKKALFPEGAAKVSIEAGVTYGWAEIVGEHGRRIGIDHFGASAAAGKLFEEYGITATHVVAEARAALAG